MSQQALNNRTAPIERASEYKRTNSLIPQLLEILEAITPLELTAVNLLHTLRSQTGEWLPTTLTPETKEQVITATVELVAYTRRSADMARLLSQLQPIPLRDVLVAKSQP